MINIRNVDHNATNRFGVKLQGYFKQDKKDENIFFLYEDLNPYPIAYIDFTILPDKKILFINDMENYKRTKQAEKSYTGIGNLLHEFVIYYLAQKVLTFPIQITVAHNSYVFHYKNGFRFLREEDNKKIEMLIANGPNEFLKKENLRGFPDTMMLPIESVLKKQKKYFSDPNLEFPCKAA